MALAASAPQATIVDTGSTNRPGMRIIMEANNSHAIVEHRNGEKQRMKMPKTMSDRLMKDLEAAGPLNELPLKHCLKSASFGSSLYIEFGEMRSGDLSCPGQADDRVAALKKDAEEILRMARGR
jgi:hypothetical protein